MDIDEEVKTLDIARKAYEEGDYDLALFVVRDMPTLDRLELTDMVQAMREEGFAAPNEVRWVLNRLDEYLTGVGV